MSLTRHSLGGTVPPESDFDKSRGQRSHKVTTATVSLQHVLHTLLKVIR